GPWGGPAIASYYGGKSLHKRSHGEAFFTVFEAKCRRDGLFLFDEPEAALSAQRQLALIRLLQDTLNKSTGAQFVICTHSPLLLAFPGAQILSFDDASVHEITYEETAPYLIYRRYVGQDAIAELLKTNSMDQ
ncbi:MAG TPA: AAA family ATPase, partial [Terriglobales bacterium]